MNEITMGSVTVICDEHRIVFKSRTSPDSRVTISSAALPALLSFLQSMSPDGHEQRAGFRVPLTSASGLTTRIAVGRTRFTVRVLDISLSGILVELPAQVHELIMESLVEVTMELANKSATLKGIVKRRIDNKYGIMFPDCQIDGELDPPGSLLVIVKAIERSWLAQQIA